MFIDNIFFYYFTCEKKKNDFTIIYKYKKCHGNSKAIQKIYYNLRICEDS